MFSLNHYHLHQVTFGSRFRRQVGLQIYVYSEPKQPNQRQNDFPNRPHRNPCLRVLGPAHPRAERAGNLEGDFQKKLVFFTKKNFSQKTRIKTFSRSFMPNNFNFPWSQVDKTETSIDFFEEGLRARNLLPHLNKPVCTEDFYRYLGWQVSHLNESDKQPFK